MTKIGQKFGKSTLCPLYIALSLNRQLFFSVFLVSNQKGLWLDMLIFLPQKNFWLKIAFSGENLEFYPSTCPNLCQILVKITYAVKNLYFSQELCINFETDVIKRASQPSRGC